MSKPLPSCADLTKWAFALNRMSLARGDKKYNTWAVQVCTAHAAACASVTAVCALALAACLRRRDGAGGGGVRQAPCITYCSFVTHRRHCCATFPALLLQLMQAAHPHFVAGRGTARPRMFWKASLKQLLPRPSSSHPALQSAKRPGLSRVSKP